MCSAAARQELPRDDIYEAEKILKQRTVNEDQLEYLVKWKGFNIKKSTWEPAVNILDNSLIVAFETAEAEAAKKKPKAKLPTAKKSLPVASSSSSSAQSSNAGGGGIIKISPVKKVLRSPRTSTPTRGEKRVRLDTSVTASPVRAHTGSPTSQAAEGLGLRSVTVNIDPDTNRAETMLTYNGVRYRFLNQLTPQHVRP